MTLDGEDLDDRQRHLLDVLTREFEAAPLLDTTSGTAFYQSRRLCRSANQALKIRMRVGVFTRLA
jgi:hypothetical protein